LGRGRARKWRWILPLAGEWTKRTLLWRELASSETWENQKIEKAVSICNSSKN
jgi:hypothetical protein